MTQECSVLSVFSGVQARNQPPLLYMGAKYRYQKCSFCGQLFIPDRRSRGRQRFCSVTECKRASKALSQKRWRDKPENKDYWRGPEQVERVRVWRKEQPEYWKRAARRIALQEKINPPPLQDDILPDDPVLVGLIAFITGSTLQEKIAATCCDLITKGREILRRQTVLVSRPRPLPHQIRPSL
jgi:hypothetical protein